MDGVALPGGRQAEDQPAYFFAAGATIWER